MKPIWDELSEEYKDSSSVVIADVDCTVETDLCSDYDVSGYPTIKYFTAETDEKGDSYSGDCGATACRRRARLRANC
jgi:protein disulfide-isomerase A6